MEMFVSFALAVFVAFVGGSFHGFAGFGSGMLMAPLLTLIFPPAVAVPTLIIISFVGSARLLHYARGEVNKPRVLRLALPAMFSLPIGLLALELVAPDTLRTFVALLVLGLVAVLASGISIRGADRNAPLAGTGLLSGFLTGVGGIGGPPVVLAMLSINDPAPNTRANLIAYFTVTEIAAIAMLGFTGGLNEEVLLLSALTAPPFVLAMHLGSLYFVRSKAKAYRSTALGFLAIVAAASLALGSIANGWH